MYKTTQWWQRKLLEIDPSANHAINHYFIVRPNVVQRAGQLSLPHVWISKTKINRTTNIKPMSSSYNTSCIKHNLVVSIFSNTETSLANRDVHPCDMVPRCPVSRFQSPRPSVFVLIRSTSRSDVDTAWQRRSRWTLLPCVFVRLSVRSFQTPSKRRTDGRSSVRLLDGGWH